MRVALDGKPLASALTGVGHYGLELATSLAALSPTDHFTLLSPTPPALPAALEMKRRAGPNFHELHLNSELLNRYWWSLGLPMYLTGSTFDLFHGTNYDIPRWNTFPSVVTIHDLSLLLHPDTHEEPLVRRARRRFPAVARSAEMIITATEAVKREICEHLKVPAGKVVVTPYAQRPTFKRLEREDTVETRKRLGIQDDFVLFVGTIEPRKNLQTLVQAFAEIVRVAPNAPQLVVAGKKGWLVDDFMSSIKLSGFAEKVCFTGYLSDEDLRALYSSCRVFVYPSLYEGFGLPPLEAMACGAPVVTSDIPVIKETVGSAAELVNPQDAGELARAILRVLQDTQTAEKLSLLGLKRASGFTWERTARMTLEVYQEALARRGRR